jgi:TolA-binding protein
MTKKLTLSMFLLLFSVHSITCMEKFKTKMKKITSSKSNSPDNRIEPFEQQTESIEQKVGTLEQEVERQKRKVENSRKKNQEESNKASLEYCGSMIPYAVAATVIVIYCIAPWYQEFCCQYFNSTKS